MNASWKTTIILEWRIASSNDHIETLWDRNSRNGCCSGCVLLWSGADWPALKTPWDICKSLSEDFSTYVVNRVKDFPTQTTRPEFCVPAYPVFIHLLKWTARLNWQSNPSIFPKTIEKIFCVIALELWVWAKAGLFNPRHIVGIFGGLVACLHVLSIPVFADYPFALIYQPMFQYLELGPSPMSWFWGSTFTLIREFTQQE